MHSTPSNIWSISIVPTPKLGCQPAQRLVHSIRQYYRSARRLQSRDDWWRLPLRLWATTSKRKWTCQANEFLIKHCQITIYRHVALMSLQLIKELVDFRIPHLPTERINIRIGIHCGMTSYSNCKDRKFLSLAFLAAFDEFYREKMIYLFNFSSRMP